ncbi:hypothetical protein ANAPRD1_00790 [Anaplasma phagocytophilum]|nr:hypothetical protein ANAPRD1_00790 [Anaplasma phagocytophilum]
MASSYIESGNDNLRVFIDFTAIKTLEWEEHIAMLNI